MFGAVRNKLLFVLWYKDVSEPDLRTGLCDGIYIYIYIYIYINREEWRRLLREARTLTEF
jgi:hypothetical protein